MRIRIRHMVLAGILGLGTSAPSWAQGASDDSPRQNQVGQRAQERWSSRMDEGSQFSGQSLSEFRQQLQARQEEGAASGWQSTMSSRLRDFTAGQQAQDAESLAGTIEGFRAVRVRREGEDKVITLARITTENGDVRVVDLGQPEDLESLDLQKGDQIRVSGRQGEVAGERAFLAKLLQAHGERHQIQREEEGAGTGEGSLAGKIEGFRAVRVQRDGEDRIVTLARITTEDGEVQVVDLGEPENLESADLRKGDRIQVTGRPGQAAGERAFLARALQARGQRYEIDRGEWQSSLRSRLRQMAEEQGEEGEAVHEGRIEGFRIVRVVREGEEPRQITLVRIATDEGDIRIVDLGNPRDLESLGLQKGDRIRVSGRRGQVAGEQALLAKLLQAHGQRYQVQREEGAGEADWQSSVRPLLRQLAERRIEQEGTSLAGRIEGFRVVRVEREGKENVLTLARITTDEGEVRVVELGPPSGLEPFDLQKGDFIRVTGRQGQVAGERAFLANALQARGERYQIEREAAGAESEWRSSMGSLLGQVTERQPQAFSER